jgi:hypothetical protein
MPEPKKAANRNVNATYNDQHLSPNFCIINEISEI